MLSLFGCCCWSCWWAASKASSFLRLLRRKHSSREKSLFFPFSSKILWMGVEKMTLCLSFPIQAYLYFLLSHFTCTTTATTRKLPSALFAALTRIAELQLDVVSPSLHIYLGLLISVLCFIPILIISFGNYSHLVLVGKWDSFIRSLKVRCMFTVFATAVTDVSCSQSLLLPADVVLIPTVAALYWFF